MEFEESDFFQRSYSPSFLSTSRLSSALFHSISSPRSTLTSEEIDALISSSKGTDYTYSHSSSYLMNGSEWYQIPNLCRPSSKTSIWLKSYSLKFSLLSNALFSDFLKRLWTSVTNLLNFVAAFLQYSAVVFFNILCFSFNFAYFYGSLFNTALNMIDFLLSTSYHVLLKSFASLMNLSIFAMKTMILFFPCIFQYSSTLIKSTIRSAYAHSEIITLKRTAAEYVVDKGKSRDQPIQSRTETRPEVGTKSKNNWIFGISALLIPLALLTYFCYDPYIHDLLMASPKKIYVGSASTIQNQFLENHKSSKCRDCIDETVILNEVEHLVDQKIEKNIELFRQVQVDGKDSSLQLQPPSKEICERYWKKYEASMVERFEEFIRKSFRTYDSDRTGIPDFALESSGASIISTRCTPLYEEKSRTTKYFGLEAWKMSYSPRSTIQRKGYGASAGECWPFNGGQGYLVVKLSYRINVTAVSYEHLPVELSPSGHIKAAPKDFLIWSLQELNDSTSRVLLGNFTYDADGEPLQMFKMQNFDPRFTPIVELETLTNHGAPVTCLYRLRVHGDLADENKIVGAEKDDELYHV